MPEEGTLFVLDVLGHVDMGVGELERFIAVGVESVLIAWAQVDDGVLFAGCRGKHLGDEVVKVSVGEGYGDWVGLLSFDAPAILL